MAHQKRRHAEPGGVADAEAAPQRRAEPRSAFRGAARGDMFGEVDREGTDEPDRQHLGLERARQFRALRDLLAIGDAELAVAVNGGGAHEIADAC
jgi:hypothetical protein